MVRRKDSGGIQTHELWIIWLMLYHCFTIISLMFFSIYLISLILGWFLRNILRLTKSKEVLPFVRPCQPTIFFILDQKMFLRLASIQCFPRWALPSNKSKKESKKWKIWKDQTKEEKDWNGLDSFFFKPASFHFPKIFFSYFCAIDEISSLLFLGHACGSVVSKVAHDKVV